MATYRQIHTHIWDDPRFEEYSPHAKLLFIWGFSNKHRTEAGMYSMSLKKMAFETGLSNTEAQAALEEIIESGAWKYDFDNKVLWVKNAIKYQSVSEKTMVAICREIASLKTPLISEFETLCKEQGYPIDTLSIPYRAPTDRVTDKDKDKDKDKDINKDKGKGKKETHAPKIKYGEFVEMTQAQYDGLVNVEGIDEITYQIRALDNYIANTAKGKKLVRHDLTIRNWIERDRKAKGKAPPGQPTSEDLPDFMQGEYGPLRLAGSSRKEDSG